MSNSQISECLPIYYKKLFPFNLIYRWLCYGRPQSFINREFSFTLNDDVYIRFLSYNNLEDFSNDVFQKLPFKIDIGAAYTIPPCKKKTLQKIYPVSRELVFDIDMTDYDDVRTCCSGACVCNKCWKFMVVACKIIDTALREDFGFEALLWVFSGRRGIHCWICDETARDLPDATRVTISEYLRLAKGGMYQARKIIIGDKMHSSVRRALRIIEPYFKLVCLEEQNVLESDDNLQKFLNILPDLVFREEIATEMRKYRTSVDRWDTFCSRYNYLKTKNQIKKSMQFIIEEIQLQYLYPRIDVEVTKQMNHLLKSPFCVHPGTGKIAVPLNPKTIDNFDVNTVPTIVELINEIKQFDKDDNSDCSLKNIRDYRKTSLKKNIFTFEEFLEKLKTQKLNDTANTSLMDF